MKTLLASTFVAALALTGIATAHADEAYPWVFKLGAHVVDPKSDNGALAGGTLRADVDSDIKPTITGEYLFTPNLGLEVLASWPFQHELKLNGAKAATFKQLPPTVSLQYHFLADARVSPFLGLGLNYTHVFSEKTYGPLAGTQLAVDDSWGVAAHVGVDFRFDARWLLTVDARWIDIDAKAKVNGAEVGKVHVDPWVYGVAVGYRF